MLRLSRAYAYLWRTPRRLAVRQCSDRGLRCSSKWAAEQLVGLRPASQLPADDQEMPAAATASAAADDEADEETEEEADVVLLAKAYFDSNEFLRAAHTLRGARAPRGRFLRWYSLFLAGEKRKDERVLEESGGGTSVVPTGKPRAVNEQLTLLSNELGVDSQAGRLDGFGHYVYGLCMRELQRPSQALEQFTLSAARCPCFWSAWTELASCLSGPEAISTLELPVHVAQHWMLAFFRAHTSLEAQQNLQAIQQCVQLPASLPPCLAPSLPRSLPLSLLFTAPCLAPCLSPFLFFPS